MLNGEAADTLVVTARTKGGQRDAGGIGVFLVPANAKGIAKKAYPTQDGLHAADITFTGVEVGADAVIGDPENALAADRARGRRGAHRALRRGRRR